MENLDAGCIDERFHKADDLGFVCFGAAMSIADATLFTLAVRMAGSSRVYLVRDAVFKKKTTAIHSAEYMLKDGPAGVETVFVLACRTEDDPGEVCYRKTRG